MSKAIRDLRNLGPRMETLLSEVEIENEDDLRAVGAVSAYKRLRFRFGRSVSTTALYAMAAALLDCDWRALNAATKGQLRHEADATPNKPS